MKTILWILAKRALCLLTLAVTAGLVLPACDKVPDQQDETPTPIYRAPYEKELRFNESNTDSIQPQIVNKFAKDTACKHIYLTVTDDNNVTNLNTADISNLRNDFAGLIGLAPNKISGRGDFWFFTGKASVEDSLWFVQNGWTINQMASHR